MSRYNLRSKRVNVIEYEPENAVNVTNSAQIRVVTPEKRRPTQFVPMYFEHWAHEAPKNFTIGVFDSEIAACHATIEWLIDCGKGIDYRLEVWDRFSCPEDIIVFLCKQVRNYNDLKRIVYEYRCVWTYETCWHIDLFKN